MTRYPWARTFIKQARLFAGLIVICAFLYVGLHYLRVRQDIESARYKENPEVDVSMHHLLETLSNSESIVSKFETSPQVAVSQTTRDELPLNYDSIENLNLADAEITKTGETVSTLKDNLTRDVRQDIDEIVSQLRAYASSQTPPTVTADKSNSPGVAPPVTMQSEIKGLFSDDVTQEEAQSRRDQLKQVSEVLENVLSRTQKPENQNRIKHSILQIHDLSGLLSYLTTPAQLEAAATAVESPGVSQDNSTTPIDPSASGENASKTADLLEQSEGLIVDALTSKWQIDSDISTCKSLVAEEEKSANAANEEIVGIWFSFAEFTGVILVSAFVAAYLVQIFSDLLQAHIDNADNSFVTQSNNDFPLGRTLVSEQSGVETHEGLLNQQSKSVRISKNGIDLGEISIFQFKSMVATGELSPQDYYHESSTGEWRHLYLHPDYN